MNSVLSVSTSLCQYSRRFFSAKCVNSMGSEIQIRNRAISHRINVSGYGITDLVEIRSPEPKLQVLFIPGNPGVISFYTEFLESLFELLGGTASVTGIGHLSHSEKSSGSGKLFSLQEQIDHKISFVEQELHDSEIPIILVAHSIGSYISLELFKRLQEKVLYCVCLYPFLVVNTESSKQSFIKKLAASPVLSMAVSSIVALFGKLPAESLKFIVRKFVGESWSSSAVQALFTCVFQYHTMRNVLFMAKTEFGMLPEKPDLDFIRSMKAQIAFLFGDDDHWGPLHFYEEVPKISATIEREGHTHAFSCTEVGSIWVAEHVSTLIVNHLAIIKAGRHS